MSNRKRFFNLLVFFLFFVLASWLPADDSLAFPHEVYQVQPNPKVTFGKLENGFRYMLLPNKTPDKRVLLYLRVDTGSLNEADSQQGISHFLEHMAFNGTKHFPNETLIDFFKKIGMDFGADTNAYTSFEETVYLLNLPEERYMKDGLRIIGDYAMNMLLEPQEIEKERGIILSEKRERDTIKARLYQDSFNFAFNEGLLAKRMPIGQEEQIKTFVQKDFIKYYNDWYRPENMILIVVGDITAQDWQKQITKSFKKFKEKSPKKEKFSLKDPNHKGNKIYHYFDREATTTEVEIFTIKVAKPEISNYADFLHTSLLEYACNSILNKRLYKLASEKESSIISGKADTFLWLQQIRTGTISATCKPENWERALVLIENELRRVLTYGFTDKEVEIFKKEYRNELENSVQTEPTRDSQQWIDYILASISNSFPLLNAKQTLDVYKPILDKLSKEDLLKAYESYWKLDHRLISVAGNAAIEKAEDKIRSVYEQAFKIEIQKPVEEDISKYPFSSTPISGGKILKKEYLKDVATTRVFFDNNIILNLKKTNFKKDEILFGFEVGQGVMSLDSSKYDMIPLISSIINDGGVGALNQTELSLALSGRQIQLSFSVEQQSFSFSGATNNADLEVALQLIRDHILIPGFHMSSYDLFKKNMEIVYNSLETDIGTYFNDWVNKILYNHYEPLFTPNKESLNKYSMADVQSIISPIFKEGAIEINIVGDVDIEKTIQLISTFFGTFEKREKLDRNSVKELDIVYGQRFLEAFKTKISKSLILIAIPIRIEYDNIQDVRYLNIIGRILSDKINKHVREEKAIAYSPYAEMETNPNFKNYSTLQMMADVEPKNIKVVEQAFLDILSSFCQKGVSESDLIAVTKPIANQIKDYVKTNEYWLFQVLKHSTVDPNRLQWSKNYLETYETVKLSAINATIKKYIDLNKKNVFVIQSVE